MVRGILASAVLFVWPLAADAQFGGTATAFYSQGFSEKSIRSEDQETCSDSPGDEFCSNSFGYGGEVSLHYDPEGLPLFFNLDGQHWFMDELGDLDAEDSESSDYTTLTLHTGYHAPRRDFGFFYMLGSDGGSQGSPSRYAKFHSYGAEVTLGQYAVLVGFLESKEDSADLAGETIDQMRYARIFRNFDLFGGTLGAGVAGGHGDQTFGSGETMFRWFQLSADFRRSIFESRFAYYIGYTGDLVDNYSDESGRETYGTHALSFGVSLSFGSEKSNTFETPNLWAPVTWAAEAN
ncbi:MAG: hypothetical protein AAFR98_03340 [Pseudomonadota bacterium]